MRHHIKKRGKTRWRKNCSIKLFESDLESMLSQVLAKACSRDEKLKAAKEKVGKAETSKRETQCCLGFGKAICSYQRRMRAFNPVPACRKQCCIGRIPHLLYAGADGRNGNQKNCRVKVYIAVWFYKNQAAISITARWKKTE